VTAPLGRYLTSTKHIVGCAAAVAGPVLALAGVVTVAQGLALIPVLYAIGVLVTPAARRDVPDVLDARAVRRNLDRLQGHITGRVPYDVSTKTARIAAVVNATLPRADALGTGSPGHYVLVACASDYLPTALQAYLDLPRHYADHQVVSDGKTPRALLIEQLDLLEAEIKEIADAVNRADTDRLIVNGRFLAERFGEDRLDPADAARKA